jgi:hypothetical protein
MRAAKWQYGRRIRFCANVHPKYACPQQRAQRRQAATQRANCLSPPKNETRIVSSSIMLVKVSGPSLSLTSYDRVVLRYGDVIAAHCPWRGYSRENVIFAGRNGTRPRWSLLWSNPPPRRAVKRLRHKSFANKEQHVIAVSAL